jgi:hypothetical protein
MPSVIPRIKTSTQLDNHSVEIQTKDNRAATIYNNLQSYDYDLVSPSKPMPGWTYIIPTNQKQIVYEPGAGQMVLNGIGYLSLTPEDKVIFWQWIDKAIVYGMKKYDTYWGF